MLSHLASHWGVQLSFPRQNFRNFGFHRLSVTADDEWEIINKNDEVDKEVTNGVTKINMDEQNDDDKKKQRRRGKKKNAKEQEPLEAKDKKQTNPPSVPIHELYPTSE